MCTFIKIEYIVANALVELCEKKKVKSVSFNTLNDYGVEVEKILTDKVGMVVLLFSEEYKEQFMRDYSDLFELGDDSIKIKDNVEVNDIRNRILDYASVDLLQALFDKSATKILGL